MGDARDQAAERGQPFGVDQILLGGVQFVQRVLGLFLGSAQLVFGLRAWRWRFRRNTSTARAISPTSSLALVPWTLRS